MDTYDKYFLCEYFKNYLKHQYKIYSIQHDYNEKLSTQKGSFSEENEEEVTCYTDRSKACSSTTAAIDEAVLTTQEKEAKIDYLNSIFCHDDLNLLNIDDIIEADFIQGVLCYMSPAEFYFDDEKSEKSAYVHILYQIKNFLHKRQFNAVKYLKDLKSQFENTVYNYDAQIAILRLTVFIAFLLKDTQSDSESATKDLVSQGLDFAEKSEIKPSFIKGLVYTLNNVLVHLESNEEETFVNTVLGLQNQSFIHSDAKMMDVRMSMNEEHLKTMASNNETPSHCESPFKHNEESDAELDRDDFFNQLEENYNDEILEEMEAADSYFSNRRFSENIVPQEPRITING